MSLSRRTRAWLAAALVLAAISPAVAADLSSPPPLLPTFVPPVPVPSSPYGILSEARFGVWLGFHKCSQDEYLAMVAGYARHFGLDGASATIAHEALEWATTRGSRSGRTAWQFIQDLAGRSGKRLVG